MPASSLCAALLLDERVQNFSDLVIGILVGSEVDLATRVSHCLAVASQDDLLLSDL